MDKIKQANRALDAVGGNAAMARILAPDANKTESLSVQWNIAKWRKKGIPGKYVAKVSEASGIPRHLLSPELFGHEAA